MTRPTETRCSDAARRRGDPLAGTASPVRTWLVLEDPGPWGQNALRDARLPHGLGRELLRRTRAARIRPLLARRPARSPSATDASSTLRRVWIALSDRAAPRLETATLTDLRALLDLDLSAIARGASPGWTASDEPFFGVCTHGRHDACCAIRGRPVAQALAAAEPEPTWEVSHIGGDRFAANLLVLPEGLYYGHLDPTSVVDVAARHRGGLVDLAHLRGRSAWSMPVQAAVVEARRHTGHDALTGASVVSVERSPGRWDVTVDLAGSRWRVPVTRVAPDAVRLTCSAAVADIPWRFETGTPVAVA